MPPFFYVRKFLMWMPTTPTGFTSSTLSSKPMGTCLARHHRRRHDHLRHDSGYERQLHRALQDLDFSLLGSCCSWFSPRAFWGSSVTQPMQWIASPRIAVCSASCWCRGRLSYCSATRACPHVNGRRGLPLRARDFGVKVGFSMLLLYLLHSARPSKASYMPAADKAADGLGQVAMAMSAPAATRLSRQPHPPSALLGHACSGACSVLRAGAALRGAKEGGLEAVRGLPNGCQIMPIPFGRTGKRRSLRLWVSSKG